ncbi:MAG: SAM-dependent methyltransferase [Desulfofustis sp.]|nr:SAM-dependent methyltransferase [Desulfofustis sp.]
MATVWHPGELLSCSSAYWRGCALQSAVRLGVFTELAAGSCSAAELAEKIGSEARATGLLMDGLSAMGLLLKKDDTYQNCSGAERFLVDSSPHYMGHIILHHHHLVDGWAQLDHSVRTGGPVQRRSYGAEIERESFIMGMFNLSMQIAPQIAEQVDLGGRARLLDLGGGPGTHAIHFCKNNPGLRALIFDRATTKPFARRTVARFELEERIDFVGGDFKIDPIPGGPYDVAWLSHILHSNTAEECYEIIEKSVAAMEKGGLILVHDFILNNNKDGPEFPALFSLNMLLAGNGGRSYAQEEICDMLRSAGVTELRNHPFRAKNDSSIIYGIAG